METNLSFIERELQILFSTEKQPFTVLFKGTYTPKNPDDPILNFIQSIHQALVEKKQEQVVVDLFDLEFINSSALKIFMYWLGLLQDEETKYTIQFFCNDQFTWQEIAFKNMEYILPDHVRVEVATKR